jgi:ABC-type sugar transport system ATPase subunit
VGIRPEHLHIQTDVNSAEEGLLLTVQQFEYMGASGLLQGTLEDGTRIEVLLQQAVMLQRGDVVKLVVDAAKLHSFDASEQRIPL